MGFVPVEKLTSVITNPYEAILVAARDARIQNSINGLKDLDPNEEHPKVTSVSLQRLSEGEIEYYYADAEVPGEPGATRAGLEGPDAGSILRSVIESWIAGS